MILTSTCIKRSFSSFQPPSLYTVKAIAILDNDGRRILAHYYDQEMFPSIKVKFHTLLSFRTSSQCCLLSLQEEKAFEKNLFTKTHKANAEIIMLDGLTCLYKSNVDLFFYVMGSSHENEVRTDLPHVNFDLAVIYQSLGCESPTFEISCSIHTPTFLL